MLQLLCPRVRSRLQLGFNPNNFIVHCLVSVQQVLEVGVAQFQRMNGFLELGEIEDEGVVQDGCIIMGRCFAPGLELFWNQRSLPLEDLPTGFAGHKLPELDF